VWIAIRVRLQEANCLGHVNAIEGVRFYANISEGRPVEVSRRLDTRPRHRGRCGHGHDQPVDIMPSHPSTSLQGPLEWQSHWTSCGAGVLRK